MASVQPGASKARHPVFGPAVAIYDDRRRTRWRLAFWILLIPLSIWGLLMAQGDLAGGNVLFAVGQTAAVVVVATYALQAIRVDIKRMKNPIRLLVARDGFELSTGIGPISWNDVETISDPRSPDGDPKNLRVQLDDPRGFAERHALSPIARLMLRVNKGDLILGSGMARPVATVETMMQGQLAEFRRSESAGPSSASQGATARTRPIRGRRSTRKR